MLRIKKKIKRFCSLSLAIYVIVLYLFVINFFDDSDSLEFETGLKKLSSDVYAVSAFWEDRKLLKSPFVRVITISVIKSSHLFKAVQRQLQPKLYKNGTFPLECSLHLKSGETISATINATIFEETLEAEYAGTFMNCIPNSPLTTPPQSVTLSTKGKEATSVTLPIQPISRKSAKKLQSFAENQMTKEKNLGKSEVAAAGKNETSVCVRALFGPYDNLRQLGQFIAYYNSVLGVKTFNFYLLQISPAIQQFLHKLQNSQPHLGINIRTVEWNLPEHMMHWSILWDYGALTLLTDCLYSGMSSHKYTYIVDLDEFIVPRFRMKEQNSDYFLEKINDMKRAPKDRRSDSVLFRNSFFCSEFNPDVDYENEFNIFKAINRQESYWSHQIRAKMLVKSKQAVAVGHHRIHDWIEPDVSYNTPVPHQVGLLNHYRSCKDVHMGFNGLGPPVTSEKFIEDDNILIHNSQFKQSKVLKIMEEFL